MTFSYSCNPNTLPSNSAYPVGWSLSQKCARPISHSTNPMANTTRHLLKFLSDSCGGTDLKAAVVNH
jgi:hypothetical protein